MSLTMTHESLSADAPEMDSDGSSSEERNAGKRLRGELDSSGPKKRRKQTTPVRFSSSLQSNTAEDSNDEEGQESSEDNEGKLSRYPSTTHRSKDENLNIEFRCQFCNLTLDCKEALNLHLETEHNQVPHSLPMKLESHPDQSESPVNLLSVKNFATSWLATHGQMGQSQSIQNEEWPINQAQLSNHLQTISGFPGSLSQYLPLPNFPVPDPGHIARPSLGPAPVRIFNPDAYCDLCNKEFCNKYFLKTHKANKHGIYVDSPGPSAENSVQGMQNNVAAFAAFSTSVKLEPPATPPMPSIPCDICQKRFKNEESLRKHKQKVHVETACVMEQSDSQMSFVQTEDERDNTPGGSPGGMEALFKQEFGIEQEDASFVPAPRHMSPHSIQQARDSGFNADRLRRLGVINPEAFCEICCKEYCNKYFLRTHKMKRHGVLVQDNEKSPSNPGSAATWHQVQTSPLNLIVAESTANSSESGDRNEDYECKQCGIRFQTIGIYQAHNRKMHDDEEELKSPKQHDLDLDQADPRTDTISEDLQKLQTMILQLNGLEAAKTTVCNICGKEFDNKTLLKVHMATDHGTDEPVSPLDKSPMNPVYCTLCEKDYPNQDTLRKHIAEDHRPPAAPSSVPAPHVATTSNNTPILGSTPSTPTNSSQTERKVTSMTPTSSYCEICNKELCNKYFMKTHMQRMHGIEIENGAQIGGVICNICNKELCSKYFLRVHKHNTHGIVDESTTNSSKQENFDSSNSEDPALKPEQLGDLSHRYFTHFTEVCPVCSRRFRSIKWLKAHLLGDHGKAGIEKWREMEQQYQTTTRNLGKSMGSSKNQTPIKIPNGFDLSQQQKSMDYPPGLGNQVLSNLFGTSSEDPQSKSYRCSYCNFTTPVLPFLFLHERSHVCPQEVLEGDRALQCPICSQGFHQPEHLHQHLLTRHQFPNILSNFPPAVLGSPRVDPEKVNDTKERNDQDLKDDRRKVSSGQNANQNQKQEDTAVQVTPQGAYKCAQCGFATTNLNRIKKHVRKDHKSIGDPTESVIAELGRTLKDVANKHKVPACYAMPQDAISNSDKTIMQPFLLEEQDLVQVGEESSSEKRFAPALVYLPVKSRINGTFTASFTLNPA
ncbi:uncharacterized protein [Prorops nasuta]|uniref:uncharacterized protein n=1 Tax=Prorops nasuta TaxID=863751 RepID=UPI0034CE1D43